MCVCVCRVLLLGSPTDNSTADSLAQAAQEIIQDLQSQSEDSLPAAPHALQNVQALLAVVMAGLASLTQAELHGAARQILRLAVGCVDDAAVSELSQQIRQAHFVCAQCFSLRALQCSGVGSGNCRLSIRGCSCLQAESTVL